MSIHPIFGQQQYDMRFVRPFLQTPIHGLGTAMHKDIKASKTIIVTKTSTTKTLNNTNARNDNTRCNKSK